MKKLLSLLVVLCVISTHFMTVSAADVKDGDIRFESAAEALSDLGLMQGDENGDLNGNKLVTRAEFATLLSRIVPGYKPVAKYEFSDVSSAHWAADCIGYFTDAGVINGYDDGRFGPSDAVNMTQASKMLLAVLGLSDDSFVYPDDYLLVAAKNGLTVGVNVMPDAKLNRNETATMILNSLYAKAADGNMLIDDVDKDIYYVSPDGSDSADGSYENPWKTLSKAAGVSGNAIVFLSEGTYEESAATVIAKGGESAQKPLIIKAAYGAEVKVSYPASDEAKLSILESADNVVVKNIIFSSESDASSEESCFVKANAGGFKFAYNTLNDAGCAVLAENADASVISGNGIAGGECAVKLVNSVGAIISNNEFNSQTEAGVAVCGASKNAQIYSNTFNASDELTVAAIVLGDEEGAYNCAIWNNIIYSDDTMSVPGLLYTNTADCHFYNNIVSGMAGGIVFNGENKKPVMRNNIFTDCGGAAYVFEGESVNLDSDYNCFNDAYPEIKEKNSKFSNPYFVSAGTNWKLISFSPARETGTVIDSKFTGFGGETIMLDLSDFDGDDRGAVWSMGVYSSASKGGVDEGAEGASTEVARKPFIEFNFENGVGKFINNGGDWSTIDGVYHQSSLTAASYRTVYEDGEAWENYEVSIDIKSPSTISENATGLLFRCDAEMQNMYSMRFLSPGKVEFVRWLDNKFLSIKKWEYEYLPETFYNFKVRANGNTFTFYINDELLGEVVDDTFTAGSVGCYSYKEPNEYDNIKIYTIQ